VFRTPDRFLEFQFFCFLKEKLGSGFLGNAIQAGHEYKGQHPPIPTRLFPSGFFQLNGIVHLADKRVNETIKRICP